ncbi:F0F1 ATP synthase subunit delta [Spiroplasma taiwanense]|uniref:ATP synthase subunit delta n=1 Tax=Spiroplasma taiwanense CT-1 TaxID=1276220 RepID=S5LVY4_9MOLU|nr:F0F1 ATP synthase subunit delta [Spiroplasma taiwanense]AGR40751.1 F0F1 ATP synthase subunit delta [Spiroplasma taiwanense CT-1]
MIKQSLIINWAEAIFEIAKEKNKVKEYCEILSELLEIFKENAEAIEFIANRNILLETRLKFIDLIFANKIEAELLNTLKLLVERNYFGSIIYILSEAIKKIYEQLEIQNGVIYSTQKLDDKLIKKIEKKIELKINQKIKLENKIDNNLLAGIRIEVLNKKYDFSLKGKIEDMKSIILTNRN